MSPPRLVLIGAGRAGSSILRAVVAEGLATVAGIVDPLGAADPDLVPAGTATFGRVSDLPADLNADVAIVAVPTPLHGPVLTELLGTAQCPPLVLCEKPLTDSLEMTRTVMAKAKSRGVALSMLLHFASAPETVWISDHKLELERRFGPCATILSSFADDYCQSDEASARARLGGPWLDSGVNSLSVVLQITEIEKCVERQERGEKAVTVHYRGRSGETITVATAWDDPVAAKTTSLQYSDHLVVIDHRTGSVRTRTELLFQAGHEPPSRRYGRMLATHLDLDGVALHQRLEAEVLTWLFASPA